VTRTTLGLLAANALILLVSALPLGVVGVAVEEILGTGATDLVAALIAIGAWTLCGVLVFLRPVEHALASILFGARELTEEERARLEPVWKRVCSLAKEDLGDYELRVEDREELNATAGGARIVAVTTLALSLPDDELAALLAHELGHHLDEHPIASLLGWWFALPSIVLDFLLKVATAVVLLAWLVRIVLLIPLMLANLASAVLNRSAEYAADRHAARLGFGPALIAVFERMLAAGHDEEDPADPGPGRLWATHPPLADRIARLRALPATA
jgi:STE24 endopeptidase